MKIFIDTANIEEIKTANDWGVIEKMFKHPLTDIGLETFLKDWKKLEI